MGLVSGRLIESIADCRRRFAHISRFFPRTHILSPMPEITSRLSTALANRYTIERELGSGGMATVYLAEDLKHKRKVAVKVLRPELAAVLGADALRREKCWKTN